MTILAQITGPSFGAGLVLVDDVCTEAAPYLQNRRLNLLGLTRDAIRAVVCGEGMGGSGGDGRIIRRLTTL